MTSRDSARRYSPASWYRGTSVTAAGQEVRSRQQGERFWGSVGFRDQAREFLRASWHRVANFRDKLEAQPSRSRQPQALRFGRSRVGQGFLWRF